MQTAINSAQVTANDRLGLTLSLAVVFHLIVILGVTFTDAIDKIQSRPELDITLVQNKTDKKPKEADFLAQTSQDGGGNTSRNVRPTSPLTSMSNLPRTGIAPIQPPEPKSAPAKKEKAETITSVRSPQKIQQVLQEDFIPDPIQPSTANLYQQSMEMAARSAELDQSLEAYAKRPKRKFISARTKEFKYATYMQQWVSKVEKIGNLNYPDQARRKQLSGSLRLDVALNADGSIKGILLERSSGQRILDDAAIRIVQLSAPFAPFPKEFLRDTNELHIIRTWVFSAGNELSSQ